MSDSKSFELQIISPDGIIFHDQVNEVSLPTTLGEITVLPHHIPLFAKLTEGEIKIKKDGKETLIAVLGGFLEIDKVRVTVVSDYAIRAENIERAKAEEAKLRAEEAMRDKEAKIDALLAEKDLRKSILELKIAEKVRKRQKA